MNINFAIISRILSIHYSFVILKLKQPVNRGPLFSEQRTKLLESLRNLDNTLLNHCDDDFVNILLYGSSKHSFTNAKILSLTVDFLESTKCFDKPLF